MQYKYVLQHVVLWEHLTDVSECNKVTPYWLNLTNCLVLYVCRSYFQFCFRCTNLISDELKKVSYERFRKWLSEVNFKNGTSEVTDEVAIFLPLNAYSCFWYKMGKINVSYAMGVFFCISVSDVKAVQSITKNKSQFTK